MRITTIFSKKIVFSFIALLSTVMWQESFAEGLSKPAVTVNSQELTIKGAVKDGNGEPIIGATVIIEGTTNGSITDTDGQYTFTASPGDVIVASFLGYKSETAKVEPTRDVYNFTLIEDAIVGDEVVVTALGIKRDQKALGYAVTEVKGGDIAAANTVSPVSALQGKAAGVSISGSDGGVFGGSKIQIRGVSTLSGNNQPIFVVDGVILDNEAYSSGEFSDYSTNDYGNQLKNLNADDFESVSVLKGSAATALYGSRGINGAVVITTKSGKGAGFGVTVSQTTGVDWVYQTPKFQNEYGMGTIAGNVTYGNTNSAGEYYKFDTNQFYYERGADNKMYPSLRSGKGMSWGPRFDNQKIIGYDGEFTDYKAYKNNMRDAYDVGVNTNTNVTIQGSSDKLNFYVSDSYNYRKGTFPGNTFERNSFLFKGQYKVSEKITIDASMNYVQSNSKNPPFSLGSYFWRGDYSRDYNVNKYKNQWRTEHGGAPSAEFGDKYGTVPGMDLWFDLNNKNYRKKDDMVIPIVKLSIKPTDWMTLNGELNMNYYNTDTEFEQLGSGYRNEGGYYETGLARTIQRSAKASMNLNKKFGDFTTSLIVGGEWFGTHSKNIRQWTKGGLIVPGQYFIENSINIPGYSSAITNTKNIYSVYFLASASWKEQLYLDVTGRNDWSTALLYSAGYGDDSYFYPSVSGSWIISESFNLPSWISFAKVRASWAQVGNDTSPYRINQGYGLQKVQLSSGLAYINTFTRQMIDPNLRPERKNSFETGFDIRLFDSRLNIDFTWYNENTRDQIIDIPAPVESGVNSQLINAGKIQNKGIELAINTTPIRNNKFEWNLNFIYTRNRNKIISLHPDVGQYKNLEGSPTYGNFRVGSVAYIGGEYGVLLSDSKPREFWNKDASGNTISDPRNGKPVLAWDEAFLGAYPLRSYEVQEVGSIFPKFEGSIYNNFKIGNFNFGFLIDMRFGGYMASVSSRYGNAYGFMYDSMRGRNNENGGITYTSKYAQADNATFHDGVIPDGVFQEGTIATGHEGAKHDLSGMTYKEAYDMGYIEPTHTSYYQYRIGAFNTGVIDDSWFREVKYVALRQVSVGYSFPKKVTSKLKLSSLNIALEAHNLFYLYNSMPNRINPESFSGNTSAGSFFEQNMTPFTATYALTIRFNL